MNGKRGFTIVELLVVIVVIGILATITIVGFTGLSQRATVSSIQSDLANASKQIKIFEVNNSLYPDTIDCSIGNSTINQCIINSGTSSYLYQVNNTVNPKTFYLEERDGINCYSITESSPPTNTCITVAIGNQIWTKDSANIGTKLATASTTPQNNGIVEKYCYNNLESNCDIYGGIYTWDEAMQYSVSENARGVCPAGFHIPSDAQWTSLTNYLGPSTAGTQLKSGGSSGFDGLFSGLNDGGSYIYLTTDGPMWTSTESDATHAWSRTIFSGSSLGRNSGTSKTTSYAVRCMKN